jgi:hypothetical protein
MRLQSCARLQIGSDVRYLCLKWRSSHRVVFCGPAFVWILLVYDNCAACKEFRLAFKWPMNICVRYSQLSSFCEYIYLRQVSLLSGSSLRYLTASPWIFYMRAKYWPPFFINNVNWILEQGDQVNIPKQKKKVTGLIWYRLLGYKNSVVCATGSIRLMLCKIWGFHGFDYEECHHLGWYEVWLLKEPTFRRNEPPPFSGW